MAPKTIKKKKGGVADSSTQLRDSDKNNSKSSVEKLKAVSKSNRESITPGKINKKDGNTANSTVELLQSVDKNPSVMSRPDEVSKSPSQERIHSKEAKTASEADIENENKRKRKREEEQNISKKDAAKHLNFHQKSKEKKILDEKHEARKKTEQRSFKSIGGMIFMCNAKTKPDCFHYRVMGVSTSRQESVMQIRPGLKLFLYDFDLRLMYGIYEASSVGGMKLEPAAFAGAFPVQVRFKIHQDCIPLPEAVFKKAIKDSYDEKTHKFKTELTVEQVNRLIELFRPVPLLHSNAKSSLPELMPASIVQPPSTLPSEEIHRQQVHRERYGSKPQQGSVPIDRDGRDIMHNSGPSSHPLFLTEREYRNYGLRSERQLLPINVPVSAPTSYTYEHNRFDHRGEQLQNNFPSLTNNVVQKEPGRPNLLFINEKEYRAYGLKGSQELLSGKTPAVETSHSFEDSRRDVCNPYDHRTTSLVNRYLSLPGPGVPVATTAEPYSPGNGVPAATTPEPYLTGKGGNVNGSRYASEIKDHSVRLNERERRHSSYASHTVSSYNRHYHHLGDDPDPASSTVSSRYSFGGPSSSQR